MKKFSARKQPILSSLFLLLTTLSFTGIPGKPFEIRKLADGVYGFVWTNPLADPIEGNSLFVINEDDVLVIDTGLFPSFNRIMIDELNRRDNACALQSRCRKRPLRPRRRHLWLVPDKRIEKTLA